MKKNTRGIALLTLVLAACGGGTDESSPPAPPTDEARIAAATATAEGHPACNAIRPFYWEIGDREARRASGSVGAATPTAATRMAVASASHWVWAAYVAERRGGALTPADVRHLTMRAGFTGMAPLPCATADTVAACLAEGTNGLQDPFMVERFFYNGGHLQRHAADLGLGPLTSAALAVEVQRVIGEFDLDYASPQPPGGLFTSAERYAQFLRAMLDGTLALGDLLGSQAVCTNPTNCATAFSTPVPTTESWRHSLGHWIESDPQVGDGAFSSPGTFGFYPWIDATRTFYGIVARQSFAGEQGFVSGQCGRLIRRAWTTGTTQRASA